MDLRIFLDEIDTQGAFSDEQRAFADKLLEALGDFNPSTSIASIWMIDDVQENFIATDEESMEVLALCKSEHDADIGINWDVIGVWAEHVGLVPKGEDGG